MPFCMRGGEFWRCAKAGVDCVVLGNLPSCCARMYRPIFAPSEEDFFNRCRVLGGFGLSSDECDPEPYIGLAKAGWGGSVSALPKANRFLRGLIGGTGGASMPFRSEAPGGRSMVSTTEVVEIKTGSPISDFLTDIFRGRPAFMLAAASKFGVLADGNAPAVGVVDDEIGGVWLANGLIGVARPELKIPGLMLPRPGEAPSDGHGLAGTCSAGDIGSPLGRPKPGEGVRLGDGRGDGTPKGWTTGF